MGDWSAWLAAGDEPDQLKIIRRNADKGLPCGSVKFIHGLEKLVGRDLAFRLPGRPRREPKKRVAHPFFLLPADLRFMDLKIVLLSAQA